MHKLYKRIISFFISLFKRSDGQGSENSALTENKEDDKKEEIQQENENTESDIESDIVDVTETVVNTETIENENNIQMTDYSKLMVHLDNGHGKATPGKRSPSATTGKGFGTYTAEQLKIYEYEYNRRVVKEVNKRLKTLGFQTYIVVPEVEGDVGLTQRCNRSNVVVNTNPHLKHIYISAHLNAAGDGVTWYTGNNASYWSAYTSKGQTQGDKLANCFYEAAQEVLPKYKKTIKKDLSDGDPDLEENFTVIAKTKAPAVLVESLFMTNVDDVLFLKSDEGFNAIVDIYVKAVIKYFERFVK